ncbi:hypothetical protein [Candidatus Nitrosocosmicus sp. SS]|jgi:hypothetical protein|uniref:hypothetical protein n=1 Tax=Candidatus Nitrosocosmicus agrestis TaxID=2563600 RepID=UPI00122E5732|nr:hypothetical protein [Candidatus Nitrosocosmicus sp. SS]KAA2280476.1 hypothetical protein F1Z66_10790 [Candidatus Nitrosocosmicus sp. SS]KAF0869255.1 hypothetical protein E5N71_05995 [Candidatus Nitrosocosmicus sp. SS]
MLVNKKNSNEELNRNISKSNNLGGIFHDQLAKILIFSIIGLIVGLIIIHVYGVVFMMGIAGDEIKQKAFDSINTSNQNLFNALLPLFGAWIGAIIAFYFGTKNMDKVYDSLSNTQKSLVEATTNKKITSESLAEIISKNSDSLNIRKVKLGNTIKEAVDQAGILSNVLLIDDNEQPLGLLFISDVTSRVSKDEIEAKYSKTSVKDFLQQFEVLDNITKQKWTVAGVKNYVVVKITDSAKETAQKLQESGFGLSARGVILNNENKPFAIISFDKLVVQ